VHTGLRWLAADELDDVAWIPADAPLVEALRRHLAQP
jgi:8-oxo-dGTP diphosphatase